jgi:hypothetical protein
MDIDDRYCPYCNLESSHPLTDEHVIPQCIGGDRRTVIRVCQPCNSNAGTRIDSQISRFSGLRIMGFWSGNVMKRQERHESHAILKDGRELDGQFYWIPAGKNQYRVGFEPCRVQSDGSKWISESGWKDPQKLPAGINLYRQNMLSSASWQFEDPATAGLEPAVVKILLGMLYQCHGPEIVRHRSFDVFRSSLTGAVPSAIGFSWVRSLDELRNNWPFQVNDMEHTIWGGCLNGNLFKGGVSLFGKVIVEITVLWFGQVLPERVGSLPLASPNSY